MAPVTPPGGDVAALPVASKGLLTIAIMGATLLQILDTTIANVALPHMQSSLGATLDTVTWVLTSYIIAAAIATPVTGWLADRIGARTLLLWSVGGFIASSMLCGTAFSLEEMVLFRALQGISGAFIGPLAQSFMLDINKPSEHGRAMSIWGMGIMVGPILGPIIGGWLTENFDWRWVFYVNVPVGIISFVMLLVLLPHKPTESRRFDYVGFGALAVALASLQLFLDRGHQLDWFESGEILIEFCLMLMGTWVFLHRMIFADKPLFNRQIFGDRSFSISLFFMVLIGIVMFSSMALLPPMMQNLFGYPVLDTGILLAPRGVGVLISMALVGRMIGKVDPRLMVGSGLVIATYAAYMMTGWSLDIDKSYFVTSGFIQGLGMGLIFIPLNTLAFATLPGKFRTDAASLLNLFRSVGSSVGISIVTVLLARNLQQAHSDLAAHVDSSTINMFDAGTVDRYQMLGDTVAVTANNLINREALMIAYLDDFYFIMWVTIVAIPFVLLLSKPKKGAAPAPMGE